MSCNYAQGLSEYSDKGVCGIPEVQDENKVLDQKVAQLAELIRAAKNIVFHTGAGISTSAGIPDFRGPRGVWTLEQKGEKPQEDVSFDRAVPTFTHRFLHALAAARGKGVAVVSQNIDGLHIRSGLKAPQLYELHGNMFLDQCDNCARLFVRNSPSPTVGQKYTGHPCPWGQTTGRRPCRGNLCDTILDWEAELPPDDLSKATQLSKQADLSICLGTTLQIIPSGTLPLLTLDRPGGKLVICNLQPTKYDDRANLVIHGYVDQVMKSASQLLDLSVPEYDPKVDPTRTTNLHTFYRTPALKSRPPAILEPEEEYLPPKRKRKFNGPSAAVTQRKTLAKKEKPFPIVKTDENNGHHPAAPKQELSSTVEPEQNGVQIKKEEAEIKVEVDSLEKDVSALHEDSPKSLLHHPTTPKQELSSTKDTLEADQNRVQLKKEDAEIKEVDSLKKDVSVLPEDATETLPNGLDDNPPQL